MTQSVPHSDLSDSKTVEVWIVDLDDRDVARATVDSLLTDEEKERASRFRFEPDAWHFRLCRAMLRSGLERHLAKPAKEIAISTTQRGKPYVEDFPLQFNVSHCHGVGLIAFTHVGEIGVDVEAVKPEIEALEIASQYFTPEETSWIAEGTTMELQAWRFTRLWTRKEAVLKATGVGLLEKLNEFDVRANMRPRVRAMDGEQVPLFLKDIGISESVLGSIAGPAEEWNLAIERVRPSAVLRAVS